MARSLEGVQIYCEAHAEQRGRNQQTNKITEERVGEESSRALDT